MQRIVAAAGTLKAPKSVRGWAAWDLISGPYLHLRFQPAAFHVGRNAFG